MINYDCYDECNDDGRYLDHVIYELSEKIAIAIQKHTGERLNDWDFRFNTISEISHYIVINGLDELELDNYDISYIHPDLDKIQLRKLITEGLEEWKAEGNGEIEKMAL